MSGAKPVVQLAVEGTSDAAIAERLLQEVGFQPASVYGLQGKHKLDERLAGFNQAARHRCWMVLRDLDLDAECAPDLLKRLLPAPTKGMCFRVAVRAVESWLLADVEGIASFLGVPPATVPVHPDEIPNPKIALVNLARRARRDVRSDMVPPPGLTVAVGPAYSARIIEFARGRWSPQRGRKQSPSLDDCLVALGRFARHRQST